ncbi:MAG TPA: metalloregulator ArsR/SmtB family transcription factor [Saprospiraceae bacterium]|nr:metalloregulator ArsR/SmtB family transcription factor [Saprospiraceae bacterium]
MTNYQLDTFQVIADPSRRQILTMLTQENMSINALSAQFDISRPAVSKHIKILETAGFISIQEVGRERHCTLKKDGFDDLQEWINFFDNFWASKLKNLEMLLDKNQNKN